MSDRIPAECSGQRPLRSAGFVRRRSPGQGIGVEGRIWVFGSAVWDVDCVVIGVDGRMFAPKSIIFWITERIVTARPSFSRGRAGRANADGAAARMTTIVNVETDFFMDRVRIVPPSIVGAY